MNYQGIQGFDISTWQDSPLIAGHVDFQKMKAWGARFVIIRAGQGNWYDLDFATSWANAKGVLPRASYWYYDNRFPPQDQARKYFDTIKHDLEGMCWVDLEDRQSGVYSGWRGWYDFIEELKAIYPGVRIGIYTGFYYFWDYITYATNAQRNYFAQYPLWLASYPSDPMNPHYDEVLVPLPWLDYLILQTGTPAIGQEVGVESKDVDYNQFNGGEDVFKQYFKVIDGGEVIPPQEGTVNMEQWKITWSNGARLREAPSITAIGSAILSVGSIVNIKDHKVITSGVEEWAQHENGLWFATKYQSEPRAIYVSGSLDPEPTPADEITVDIDVTASINGKTYIGSVMGLKLTLQ